MSGVRLQERLYGQTGKEDGSGETPREDDKMTSPLLTFWSASGWPP